MKWFIEECHPLKPSDFGVSKKSVFKEVSITEIQLLFVNERPITEVLKTFNMSCQFWDRISMQEKKNALSEFLSLSVSVVLIFLLRFGDT